MPTSARDTHRGKRADVGIGPYDRYRKVYDKSEFDCMATEKGAALLPPLS
jgi:hypothetical protein